MGQAVFGVAYDSNVFLLDALVATLLELAMQLNSGVSLGASSEDGATALVCPERSDLKGLCSKDLDQV